MTFSWSTFLLEIVNFAVLVWILKRFLYQPVLAAVERRRSDVEKSLADAEAQQASAEALRTELGGRIADWEKERSAARDALTREIAEQRASRLAALDTEISEEREKALATARERDARTRRRLEATAVRQGAAFASKLLEGIADDALHERLAAQFISTLRERDADGDVPWAGAAQPDQDVRITTAYALTDATRTDLEKAITDMLGRPVGFRYSVDPALIAGLSVDIGAWNLSANLRDELAAFAAAANVEASDG